MFCFELNCFLRSSTFAAAFALIPFRATAALLGFADPTAYVVNQSDAGSAPTLVGDAIQLTSGADQTRSLWFKEPQAVGPFQARFAYRLLSVSGNDYGQGVTFTLQSSSAGTAAIGNVGSSRFGYQGIDRSVALSIEIYNSATDSTFLGSYAGGTVSGGAVPTLPVDARQGRDVLVTLRYDGTTFQVTLNDGTSTYGPRSFLVGDLASRLGPTAFVGFTARAQAGFSAGTSQRISGFEFVVPEPSVAILLTPALARGRGRRRQAVA